MASAFMVELPKAEKRTREYTSYVTMAEGTYHHVPLYVYVDKLSVEGIEDDMDGITCHLTMDSGKTYWLWGNAESIFLKLQESNPEP